LCIKYQCLWQLSVIEKKEIKLIAIDTYDVNVYM